MISYGSQYLEDDDIEAVVGVLRSAHLTQGPAVERFEEALVASTGARFAVAFSSGTAALHGAMQAAGLGPSDRVVTSPLSFVASANSARYVGAEVAFVDIDPSTLNLDLAAVPACDAVVVVHYAGLPADLRALSERPRVVIEDAAHALGAHTPDGPVGNCAHSDMCAFSFHPVKVITTGEGGAVTTNSCELAERLRRFRNHGIHDRGSGAPWYYAIDDLGYNYRLSDVHAALGVSQMRKLRRFLERRQALADRYHAAFVGTSIIRAPRAGGGFSHANHLYAVRVANRDDVAAELRQSGIATQVHYIPIYRHRLYEGGHDPHLFPATEEAFPKLLSLPLFPGLTEDAQDRVIEALVQVDGG